MGSTPRRSGRQPVGTALPPPPTVKVSSDSVDGRILVQGRRRIGNAVSRGRPGDRRSPLRRRSLRVRPTSQRLDWLRGRVRLRLTTRYVPLSPWFPRWMMACRTVRYRSSTGCPERRLAVTVSSCSRFSAPWSARPVAREPRAVDGDRSVICGATSQSFVRTGRAPARIVELRQARGSRVQRRHGRRRPAASLWESGGVSVPNLLTRRPQASRPAVSGGRSDERARSGRKHSSRVTAVLAIPTSPRHA
jgi:hypothetical protein